MFKQSQLSDLWHQVLCGGGQLSLSLVFTRHHGNPFSFLFSFSPTQRRPYQLENLVTLCLITVTLSAKVTWEAGKKGPAGEEASWEWEEVGCHTPSQI